MGGCCCCSSKGAETDNNPSYYYYPRSSEEHVPLSSHPGAASALSTGLLVDTNLDTSVPDAFIPPPAPIPFDAGIGRPQTPPTSQVQSSKIDVPVQTTPNSAQDSVNGNTQDASAKCEELKESECKTKSKSEVELTKEMEVELSKSTVPGGKGIEEEEEVCPTCLEEYDDENPKITTKCEHHFHLACIFEWMERSDTCPVCSQEMIFDPPID